MINAKLHKVAEALKSNGLTSERAFQIREHLMIEKDPIKIKELRKELYALRGIELKDIPNE